MRSARVVDLDVEPAVPGDGVVDEMSDALLDGNTGGRKPPREGRAGPILLAAAGD